MNFLIVARDLCKKFGTRDAVLDLSFSVRAGEIYGLVGPDGAGKTTTLRLLCAAILPTSGQVLISGYDMLRYPEKGRLTIGYLAQRFALYNELTVFENLRFFAEMRGVPADEWRSRSLQTLEFVGLAPYMNRRAGKLSGGMKQKLGLAVALVKRPLVLLLDEPTTGVDPVTRQDFWQLIIHLVSSEKVAVLVTTPYMDEAARCMRLGFMRQGRLVLEGTPGAVRGRLSGRILEVRAKNISALRPAITRVPGVEDVQMFGDRLHIRVASGELEQVRLLLQETLRQENQEVDQVMPVEAQLEDVFISLQQETSKDRQAWK